jgi:hypothetical protein
MTALPVSPQEILRNATDAVEQRGEDYDSDEGERSMAHTVRIYEAVTGIKLSERQGWLFIMAVKLARAQQSPRKLDHYVDVAGFSSLLGECSVNAEPR